MKKKKQIKKINKIFINENLLNIHDLLLFLNEDINVPSFNPLIQNLEKYKKNPEDATIMKNIIMGLRPTILPVTPKSRAETGRIPLFSQLRNYKSQLEKLQKTIKDTEQKNIITKVLSKISEIEKEETAVAKSTSENELLNYYWQKMFSAYNAYSNSRNELEKKLKTKFDPSLEQTIRAWNKDLELINGKEKQHFENFLNTLKNKEKVAFSCNNFSSPEGQICKKAIDERAAAKEKIVTRFVLQFLGKKVPQEYAVKSREPYAAPQDVAGIAPGILGKIGSGVRGAVGRFKELFTEYKDISDEVLLEMFVKADISEQMLLEITDYKNLSLKEAMEKEYD